MFLEESDNPNRKTKYDLIAVEKGNRLINMDSQIPNKVVEEWLKEGNLFGAEAKVRHEVVYGNSRFDLYIESGERKFLWKSRGLH